MGLMRFLTPQPERVSEPILERAYVAGWDCVPTASRQTWEGTQLLRIERAVDESGNFCIPWRVAGHGELTLATASLMEREQPYHLPVELARGTLNRLRSKTDIWRMAGLQVSDELSSQIKSAVASFTRAATQQADALGAAAAADETILKSLDAMWLLGDEYSRQVLDFRHESATPLTTLLAGNLGSELISPNSGPMFGAAFNTAVIPFPWRHIQPTADEWDWSLCDKQMQFCLRYGMKVFGGPLVQLDRDVLPDWIIAQADDFDLLTHSVRQFITATVERYRSRVHLWHCAAGINKASDLPLSDEQEMRLTVLAIEATRRVDARTPVIVSLDQPWGEYMAFGRTDLPPMHYADTLVRAELGIAGLGLEINLGFWPGGSLPRDLLEISELLDQWSLLGLPLIVFFTLPSGTDADSNARPDVGPPLSPFLADELTPQSHKQILDRLLPVILAKPSVHAIVWNQVFDAFPHKYPHAGLFTAAGMPKPSLSTMITLRRTHLE